MVPVSWPAGSAVSDAPDPLNVVAAAVPATVIVVPDSLTMEFPMIPLPERL